MECLKDPLFAAYDCVILDEAHERTLHTDVLLGILKKAIRHRPELKVVITSATLVKRQHIFIEISFKTFIFHF